MSRNHNGTPPAPPTLPGVRVPGQVGDELDRFYTPQALADQCVDEAFRHVFIPPERVMTQRTSILDPSVGGGAFARAARKRWPGAEIVGVDIDPGAAGRNDCDFVEGNFLKWGSGPKSFDLVITNPPFSDAKTVIEFVRLGLDLAPVVAYILPWGGFGGVEQWASIMEGARRPVVVRPIRPRPWGANVRETALFVWRRERRSILDEPGTQVHWFPRWKP